jgi:hypothetical protein
MKIIPKPEYQARFTPKVMGWLEERLGEYARNILDAKKIVAQYPNFQIAVTGDSLLNGGPDNEVYWFAVDRVLDETRIAVEGFLLGSDTQDYLAMVE